jgi:dolichyl-diphosphooligosaccharide--protein glycosyltransferase
MQIPFVGFQPVRTSEHMLAAGVFALLQAYTFIDYLYGKLPRAGVRQLFFGLIIIVGLAVFAVVVLLTYAGYIAPWSGRFYSLWDTNYAKIHIPIIASVSEHQPTTWTSFFFGKILSSKRKMIVEEFLFRSSFIDLLISGWRMVLY